MKAAERAPRLLQLLHRTYPQAHCELNHSNPLELLIATILSAQCTDKRVNLVTPALFSRYRTVQDYVSADPAELERLIGSINFFRNKTRNIIACCRQILDLHGGEIPRVMASLSSLPGVGRKTANVVLSNAFNIHEGVVVDTHVARLSQRLGLTREKTPEKIEKVLVKLFPRDEWGNLSHLLIFHGRHRCAARNPDCGSCELRDLCPSAAVNKDQ